MKMIVTGVGAAVLASCGLFGQTAPPPPAFEVASVKPANPEGGHIGIFNYPGGRISVSQYTLEFLVMDAFAVEQFQVTGGPRWIRVDRYDIEAKPPASSESSKADPPSRKTPLNDEQRRMLQALLADRFQLRFHRETKEGPVYLLVKGNTDLKLQDAKNKDVYPWAGSIEGGPITGDGIAGINISMPQLATRLSGYLRRPVLDRTGLKGSFDFKFEYPAGPAGPALGVWATMSGQTSDELLSADPAFGLIFSVLRSVQGIGLKLDAAKGPVETIVIDRAEKPSEN